MVLLLVAAVAAAAETAVAAAVVVVMMTAAGLIAARIVKVIRRRVHNFRPRRRQAIRAIRVLASRCSTWRYFVVALLVLNDASSQLSPVLVYRKPTVFIRCVQLNFQ